MNADNNNSQTNDSPTAALILALRRLNRAAAVSNRAMGASLGIKDSDFAVLDLLSQEGPKTPTELSRSLGIHVATMTGILSRLERDGWIERRTVGADRRSILIHATGTERLTAQFESVNKQIATLVDDLPTSQTENFVQLLLSIGDIALGAASENSSTLEVHQ